MLNYTLKPFAQTDKAFVYDTKKEVYKPYVEQNWGEWNEQTQQELFEKFLAACEKEIQIVLVNNKPVGFFHGENLDQSTYEIQNICIIPAFQGKGIGTNILNKLIDEHKHQTIKIQCFKQNPVKNLYERLGFKLTNETQFHYQLTKHKGEQQWKLLKLTI